jgi:hypothetical protein
MPPIQRRREARKVGVRRHPFAAALDCEGRMSGIGYNPPPKSSVFAESAKNLPMSLDPGESGNSRAVRPSVQESKSRLHGSRRNENARIGRRPAHSRLPSALVWLPSFPKLGFISGHQQCRCPVEIYIRVYQPPRTVQLERCRICHRYLRQMAAQTMFDHDARRHFAFSGDLSYGLEKRFGKSTGVLTPRP